MYENLIENGIKNIALTSENPAYNPYHRDLIKVKNLRYTNMVTTLGTPYKIKYEKFLEEMKAADKDFRECGSFELNEGSTYTCSVAYINEVQNTTSISNNQGVSYHKSYGKVYSKGDTTIRQISCTTFNQIK